MDYEFPELEIGNEEHYAEDWGNSNDYRFDIEHRIAFFAKASYIK